VSALAEAARRTRRRAVNNAGAEKLAGVRVRGGPPVRQGAAVLLASEGREFSPDAIARAAELAEAADGRVTVLSIARVHGSGLGLPNPGLMPTKEEWRVQHELVGRAVKRLRKRGLVAEGQVLGTRKPAQRINALAAEIGAGAIVMGADADRSWMISSMLWSQEPQHVRRRAKVDVHLV
jgi:nucleotide-binding universal stress UspA family protein